MISCVPLHNSTYLGLQPELQSDPLHSETQHPAVLVIIYVLLIQPQDLALNFGCNIHVFSALAELGSFLYKGYDGFSIHYQELFSRIWNLLDDILCSLEGKGVNKKKNVYIINHL